MKQQKKDGDKTLWEIKNREAPTVWEVGRKFNPSKNDYYEVNGEPNFKKKRFG